MQAVVELPLKCPFKLRMIEIAWMEFEAIGVHWNRRVPEVNQNFNAFTLDASREIQQRMFIELQLRKNTFEPGVGCGGHIVILMGVAACALECGVLSEEHNHD